MAAGPHPPFVLVRVLCPRSLARWTGCYEGSGPSRVPRTAQPAEPVRRCARPAPQHSAPPHTHTARARTPQPHTLTVTRPAGGAAPARPRWPPRPCSGHTFPVCPAGTRRPSMKPQAGLYGPLPTPPWRQRQVRVHNCQARPQPPPSGFPAPRDYRSCGGSVSAWRPRPGGGAGQVTALLSGLGARPGRAPGSVAMAATSSSFGTGRCSSFSTQCPCKGRSPLAGPPRGQAVVTASDPPALAF